MKSMKWVAAVALTAIVGVAACDRPQDTDPAAGSVEQGFMPHGMDPDLAAAMTEMQEIQQRLGPVQRQALEDEALAAELESLTRRIDQAMREENGELIERIERFQADLAVAQEAGDHEAIQARMGEAQDLQLEVEALQMAVLDRPDIKERMDAFEAAHRARMIEIDPDAEALLDRVDELLVRFGSS